MLKISRYCVNLRAELMSNKRHIFDISNLTVGIIGAAAGVAGLVLAYGVAIGWTPGIFGFGFYQKAIALFC